MEQETRYLKLAKLKAIKRFFGWTNQDIANKIGSTEKSVKSRLSASSKQKFPSWADAIIATFETIHQSNNNKKSLTRAAH
jgi:hypothetical protein